MGPGNLSPPMYEASTSAQTAGSLLRLTPDLNPPSRLDMTADRIHRRTSPLPSSLAKPSARSRNSCKNAGLENLADLARAPDYFR